MYANMKIKQDSCLNTEGAGAKIYRQTYLNARIELMLYRRRPQQKSPYLPTRRIRYFLSRLFGTRLQKSQHLYFVTIHGQRFKRLILRDSFLASAIEHNLEGFGESEHFPLLIIRYEHEIWVEFIEGDRIRKVDDQFVEKVADFFAAVYIRQPRHLDITETPFLYRLHRDLHFLKQVNVLTDNVYRELDEAARCLTPRRVWVGFDYTDPVLKNFVINQENGRVSAVDVESLLNDQLIGTGVAKACVRWLEPFRKNFLNHLADKGVPDFQSYLAFVELCFLATWTKTGFLERKWKFVDPALFDRFRRI